MTPENIHSLSARTSGNPSGKRHGRQAVLLSQDYEVIASAYAAYLDRSLLKQHSRRTYLSAVRGYLHWLDEADIDGDPLVDNQSRNEAVYEYKVWLQTVAARSPVTVNKAMAALDNLYIWRGMGTCGAQRADTPQRTSRILGKGEVDRYLHSGLALPSVRDRAIALMPLCAGTRIAEVVNLDIDDIEITVAGQMASGMIRLDGVGASPRSVPIHQNLLLSLAAWRSQRMSLYTADPSALFVSRRGSRLTSDALSDVIRIAADDAHLDGVTANILRHTFEINLTRQGTASATIAYLLGRAARKSARPTVAPLHADLARAISTLPADKEPSQPAGPSSVDLAAAREAYKASLDTVARLAASNPDDADWQQDLAASHARVGDIELRTGNLAAAREAYKASLDTVARLAASNPDDTDWQQELQIATRRIRDLPTTTTL